jgi:hypothetical protein
MVNRLTKRAIARDAMLTCLEEAARQVGVVEARKLWLGTLKRRAGAKPRRAPVVVTTDRQTTEPLPPGLTRNALAVVSRTGRLPEGEGPWRLRDGE